MIPDPLRTADIPRIARRNFRHEIQHMLLWGTVIGAIDSEIASVVAAKTFNASQLLTTIVWAIPLVTHLLNVFWGVALRGRARVRAYLLLCSAHIVALATIFFTPCDTWWGGWVFAGQILCANLFQSGIITLRTSMWRANYPATHRARISSLIATVRLMIAIITSTAMAAAYDYRRELYTVGYLTVAVLAVLSLIPFGRIRVRRERAELRHLNAHLHETHGTLERSYMGGLRESLTILRTDRAYARYLLGQFLLGSANFFSGPVLVGIVTRHLQLKYVASAFLLAQLPQLITLIVIRYWAPYYDRVGLVKYRIVNAQFWMANFACLMFAGPLLLSSDDTFRSIGIVTLVIARILHGLAHGGGQIAWSIGHLHFAPVPQIELYMALHVALTGVRGLIMPFLGYFAHQAIGGASFSISFALAIAAWYVFRQVDDQESEAAAIRKP